MSPFSPDNTPGDSGATEEEGMDGLVRLNMALCACFTKAESGAG